MRRRVLITFLLFTFFHSFTKAQDYDITYSFEQDTVQVKVSQTFSNKIIVKNNTGKRVQIKSNTNLVKGLINLPDTLFFEANEVKIYPLKYIANNSTIKASLQAFSFSFTSNDPSIAIEPVKSFYTALEGGSGFRMETEQTEYYLDQSTNQAQLMIHASNRGLVPVSFRLVFLEIPEGLEFLGDMMITTLQPGSQMLLPFTIKNKLSDKVVDFNVSVQAIDESNTEIAVKRIRVMSIGSVKRFGSTNNNYNQLYNNSLSLNYLSRSQTSSVFQLQGNGNLIIEEDKKLNYRFNLDKYQDFDGIELYDTYLEYLETDWGVKIGNIYENLDYSLNGRGVKASVNIDPRNSISIYGIQNNYMLVDNFRNWLNSGEVIAANYDFKIEDRAGNISYVHSTNSDRGITHNQLSGKTPIELRKNHQLNIELGYSLETNHLDDREAGASVGTNYNVTLGNYQLSTFSYYSSPYYTGLRRGIIQSDNRVFRTLSNNQNLSARISYLNNSPKFLEEKSGKRINNKNEIQIYELGYGINMKNINIGIKPYLVKQSLSSENMLYLPLSGMKLKSESIRLITSLNYFSDLHRFSFNADYGYTYKNTAEIPTSPFHSLRLNSSYNYSFVGINGYVQVNPFYISDIYSAVSDGDFTTYSIGPSANFKAFEDKLSVQSAAMYNYYGFSKTENYSINGDIRWRLKSNWTLTGNIQYSLMETRTPYGGINGDLFGVQNFDNTYLRIGIENQFSQLANITGKKLELVYFEDHNSNGIRDSNEPTVEGVLVKVDKDAALTDKKGKVVFKNMVPESYTIQIVNKSNWTALYPTNVIMTKNQYIEVPLVKTKVLKGEIQLETQFGLQKPSLAGIRINAVDDHGREYNTLSDANGNYLFYLPTSTYTVFIEADGMPFSILNPSNNIEVNDSNTVYSLNFKYKDNRRNIDVKRFN